jgi:hypothetical protein
MENRFPGPASVGFLTTGSWMISQKVEDSIGAVDPTLSKEEIWNNVLNG